MAGGPTSQPILLQGRRISGLGGQSAYTPYSRERNFLAGETISQCTLLQGGRIFGLVGQSPNAPYCRLDQFLGWWDIAPYGRGVEFLGWWDILPTHPTAGEPNFWGCWDNLQTHPTAGKRISGLEGQSTNAPYCKGDKFLGW